MHYFTEQAPSHREALERIRLKYGEHAKILTHRTVRVGGILGFFAREGIEVTGYVSQEAPKPKPIPANLEEEKRKLLAAVKSEKSDTALQTVLKEIQEIKERIDRPREDSGVREEHPTVVRMEDLLVRNEFSLRYTRTMLDRIKRDFSLDDLSDFQQVQDRVVAWIGESIEIFKPQKRDRPYTFILVGPTGVGKTTTIAKLAAVYGIGGNGRKPMQVRIITIDNYRIGAKQQIETYGEIMGIPVSCVDSFDELKKMIALYQDVDIIFIDTIGKSPKDYSKLAEMKAMLDACTANAEAHLALCATTKTSDMYEVMQQFEPFNYKSIILTKMDETGRVGNVISALSEKGKAVSFMTDGQMVPQDIERASVVRLLLNLEGFRINRQQIEERFPVPQEPRIQWR